MRPGRPDCFLTGARIRHGSQWRIYFSGGAQTQLHVQLTGSSRPTMHTFLHRSSNIDHLQQRMLGLTSCLSARTAQET